jgi:hypothetical protein
MDRAMCAAMTLSFTLSILNKVDKVAACGSGG